MKVSQLNNGRPWWARELNLSARVERSKLVIGNLYFWKKEDLIVCCQEDGDTEKIVCEADDTDDSKIYWVWKAVEGYKKSDLSDLGALKWISREVGDVVMSEKEWRSNK